MADRTVTVRLRADVSGYTAGLARAQAQTNSFSGSFSKKIAQNQRTLKGLSTGLLGLGAIATGLTVLAVKRFADFDKAMSKVQAATDATKASMGSLREAAIQAGADTSFSATQAADGIEQLAKAGVSTSAILKGGLRGALDLAAAGELEVGEAAEIAASAMTQFNLEGSKIPHLADLIAAGAGKAQGDVTDLGAAMKQSGLVASQFNLSIEETVGTLSAFASAGLVGSDAGTSFKQMLLRLGNPSGKAAALMKKLNIETYDAQGNFIGITALAGELRKELKDLTPAQRNAALATIFGSDAIRAANVLYKQGAGGIQGWIDKVNDSGFASRTAAKRLDNLAGDIEKFSGEVETAFIKAGSAGNDFAREVVQAAERVVGAFNKLTPAEQDAALKMTAVVGAAALLSGGLIRGIVAVNNLRGALTGLGGAANLAKSGLRGLGIAGIAIAVVELGFSLAQYAGKASIANVSTSALAKSLTELGTTGQTTGALVRLLSADMNPFTGQARDSAEAMRRFQQSAEQLKPTLLDLVTGPFALHNTAQISAFKEQISQLDSALAKMASGGQADAAGRAFDEIALKLRAAGLSMAKIRSLFPQYAAASEDAAAAVSAHARAEETVQRAMNGAKVSAQELKGALDTLAQGSQSVEQANLAFRDALAQTRQSMKENGKSLSENTAKGRANRAAMLGAAQQATALSDAVYEMSGSQKQANSVLAASRARLVAMAANFLGSKKAAEEYVTEILGIPPVKKTDLQENAKRAQRNVDALRRAINAVPRSRTTRFTAKTGAGLRAIRGYAAAIAGIPSHKTTTVTVRTSGRGGIGKLLPPGGGGPATGGQVAGGRVIRRSTGGPVSGPGGPTDDKAGLYALSDKEWVTRAQSVARMERQYGRGIMSYINRHGSLPPGVSGRMANGGQVQGSRFGASSTPSPNVNVGGTDVSVLIDGKEFRGMIQTQINRHDRHVTSRARQGTGTR